MADSAQAPMNGNYPAQHAYHDSYNHTHAAMNNAANFQPAQSSTPTNAPPADQQKNGISKDEVGWYFVEQYYTNMSRSPEKLHLFYSRRSQFIFGTEAETVTIAMGTKAIQEKIKELDFQDCKVRVLNVDSQASFDNILIAVIGEISNKGEASRKFVQTFVLAEQPNGYYVLNDIFRFLVDEEEIVNEEAPAAAPAPVEETPAEAPAQAVTEPAPAAEKSQVDTESAAAKVDEKLEEAEKNGEEVPAKAVAEQTNGTETKESEAPVQPAVAAEPEAVQPEKPATPESTPAVPAQKEAPAPAKEAAPAPAPAPAKALPKTWANIASKSGASAPVVPAIPVSPAKPAPAAAPAVPQPAAATPAAPAPEPTPASQPSSNDGSGWQTAGQENKKNQSRSNEEQNTLGYIKNVTDKVDPNLLRQTLTRFGKLKHFDVNRTKSCAFVEFADPAGYAAAVAANPHQIGTEQISVEERRARANAYGGAYGAGRGGAGRGRGDRAGSQGRGGFQRDGRGGFAPRGRGGNVNAKGRNQAPAA